jgi:hypothetical protein
MIYLTTLILTLFLTQIARALPQACDDPILPAWATQEEYGEELYEFMIPSPLRTTYDGTYDNKHGSLNSVACSNGDNGLVLRFPTFGNIPSFPYIGGAFDVVCCRSRERRASKVRMLCSRRRRAQYRVGFVSACVCC